MRFATISLLFAAAICHNLSAEPVGMLLRVNGEVKLVQGTAEKEAFPGEILEAGDKISVVSGEALVSYCPDNSRFRIGAGTQVELGSAGMRKLQGSDLTRTGTNTCVFPAVRLGEESLERVGALRPRGEQPMTVYLGGDISTSRPRFSWKRVESCDRYRVRVFDEFGTPVWEAETDQIFLDYPPDRPELEPGWYNWKVSAFRGREDLAEQETGFVVRPGGDRPHPGKADPDLLIPTAFAFEAEGYFAEAAACLQRYMETETEDTRLQRRVAWLYRRAGLLLASAEAIPPGAP